jgi:predicted unusual protein kinase regulating ubiquinone biosynthesis (AarF/ABC1/UbiB family)
MFQNIIENTWQFIAQTSFILNTFFIVSSETICYYIYSDYSSFVERVTKRLASINILYVKMFQAIALNNNLINDKMNNKLLKFTDNAPWNYNDIRLYDLIEICDKYDIKLDGDYEKPINSGMISLVYKGLRKSDGKQIVIKMKRNNIELRLADGIKNLQAFLYILSFIPIFKKYQIAEVINKNIDMICHQTNFIEEVKNIITMKENSKNLKYVVIPDVYEELTQEYPDFIMMDYINGIKTNELNEEDYRDFAKIIIKYGIVTTLVHGVTHGDLHSGNILFIKDENDKKYKHKIGVIDFGVIYDLGYSYKTMLFEIFSEVFTKPSKETAIKLLNSGLIEPKDIKSILSLKDYNNLLQFVTNIVENMMDVSKKDNQIKIYNFFTKFKEFITQKEFSDIGLQPSDEFIKIQFVLSMSHGVTLTLCKDEFTVIVDESINELFHINMIF